ncbi:MAG TPA: hypothetical protein VEH31_21380, partial [Streptosporangiaceae bacterium]|nr:hypothetical protein [Streptosporangiaceae bacterium]
KATPTATAGVQPFDRHRGLALKGDETEVATGPNGAITSEAAMNGCDNVEWPRCDGSRWPHLATRRAFVTELSGPAL